METPQEESRIRVEAPSPVMSREALEEPALISGFYPLLMVLALGCSAASLFLAAFSHWEVIKGALG